MIPIMFFFSSRRRHTRSKRDWSSDVCSSDLSVGDGQMEGARSNGMTYTQAMRYVILPQALKIVIPPLGNQFINLIKNSSVLAFVAGFDLMYQADVIAF